jgi:hypothetical protein
MTLNEFESGDRVTWNAWVKGRDVDRYGVVTGIADCRVYVKPDDGTEVYFDADELDRLRIVRLGEQESTR